VDNAQHSRICTDAGRMTDAARRADDFRRLAAEQCGLLASSQLAQLSVSYGTTRSNIDAGRWRRLSPRVVALHNGPLNEEQEAWFAVLDGAPNACWPG